MRPQHIWKPCPKLFFNLGAAAYDLVHPATGLQHVERVSTQEPLWTPDRVTGWSDRGQEKTSGTNPGLHILLWRSLENTITDSVLHLGVLWLLPVHYNTSTNEKVAQHLFTSVHPYNVAYKT